MKKTEDIITTIGFIIIITICSYASLASTETYIKDENLDFQFKDKPTLDEIKDTEINDIISDNINTDIVKKKYHIIDKNDTIYSIARRYNINPIKLMKINKCGKCNTLKVGDEIKLY